MTANVIEKFVLISLSSFYLFMAYEAEFEIVVNFYLIKNIIFNRRIYSKNFKQIPYGKLIFFLFF